jgi:hypothetical protein
MHPGISGGGRSVLLALVVGIGLVAFLGIRPYQPWIIWLVGLLAALSTDGIIRSHPRWEGDALVATASHLFLPAIAVVGAGFFIDHAVDGFARPISALVPTVAVGLIAYGEYKAVDFGTRRYGAIRLALAVATYLAAFAAYTVIFTNHVGVATGAFYVGAVSLLLAIELLRESRQFGSSSALVGLAIGVTLAELRIALYFFPLDGLLAGALLIIGFYLATGLVHHLLDHDLEWSTAAEYLLVAAVGSAAVVITRTSV